jgi:D-alanyl-lipoteichoic acid acyltransferase DltB (MBOAT superfamily)
MTIASLPFLGFALLAAILYNLPKAPGWRAAVFLAANIAFLASFSMDWAAYVPLLLFLAVGFAAVRALQATRSERLFWLALVLGIAVFLWLKRYSFIEVVGFLPIPYLTIGLSYIFFRTLHLVIDARDGNLPARIGLVAYVNYMLNFTTLVSGPIQRYQDFARMQDAATAPPLDIIVAGNAIERIVVGLFKTIVLSALLSAAHERAVAELAATQPLTLRALQGAWVAVSYTIYLYFNFSGYTDIVIGVARFLRLELPENFNRPFASKNFLEFWARWHITLSDWFKIYLYNPLVKWLMPRFPSPRVEPLLAVFAFFVTFFLIGLWHGQTSMFIVYGLLLGLGASGNKLFQVAMAKWFGKKRYKALAANPAYQLVARGLTFAWLSASLVCFWADPVLLGDLARRLGPAGVVLAFVAATLGCGAVLSVWEAARRIALAPTWESRPVLLSRYVRTAWATALVLIASTTMMLMASPAPDVVYKSF